MGTLLHITTTFWNKVPGNSNSNKNANLLEKELYMQDQRARSSSPSFRIDIQLQSSFNKVQYIYKPSTTEPDLVQITI